MWLAAETACLGEEKALLGEEEAHTQVLCGLKRRLRGEEEDGFEE